MKNKWNILAGVSVVLIVFAGSTVYKHMAIVNFQEYRPTATLSGNSVTDVSIVVKSSPVHKGGYISKKLILSMGSNMIVSESDTSGYSSYTVDCSGTLGGCRLLHDSKGRPIRLAVELNGDNTPMNQEIEYVTGKTLIAISDSSPSLITDSDIVHFVNSLQQYKYSDAKVLQQ